MNSKHLLFQITILLFVSFNTVRAIQQVQTKLVVQPQNLVYSDTSTVEVMENAYPDKSHSISIHSALGKSSDNFAAQKISVSDFSTATTPPAIPILATPTSAFQGPDEVLVPILLYHRIDVSSTDSQYYVPPDKFEEQMKLLHDWGYTAITTELLVKAITKGADLPLHPILITFDDGHLDNYTTAFPIIQKYGFTGVLYIIGEYMGTPGYMNADQIKEMAKNGWEVGSHTMTHPDLTSLERQRQLYEIVESRNFLETKLSVPILTFAYPFGESDRTAINLAYSAGYIAAMGLGYTHNQGTSNLFALQRRGVNGTHDLRSFASFLPWQGDLVYLTMDELTPSLIQDPTNILPP